MKIIIATVKTWNIENAVRFQKLYSDKHSVLILNDKKSLTLTKIGIFAPDYMFFPHWSYRIPDEIYRNYRCIVFHMTDLPFGRGGSPLQNLIVKGYSETKISALKVVEDFDAGPVFLKRELSLRGTANEILKRASDIIFDDMIPYIIEQNPEPCLQEGKTTVFKRRTPQQSLLDSDMDIITLYNHIRMLDGEGYPNAFIQFGDYKLEFTNAKLEKDSLSARVVFRRGLK